MAEKTLSVSLIAYTPAPEETIALSARLCYSGAELCELRESSAEDAPAFIEKLTGLGHFSPVEHANFTFGVAGVSRALLAQLTRHRIASFSVQSQRYVKAHEPAYIVPPSVKALGPDAAAEYEREIQAVYGFYEAWLDKGLRAEDARFILPNAAETRLIMTMNARELMHFFSLRCCFRAQWEIRRLAWAMLGMARREAPALFSGAGPGCISGACSEGKMCCGKADDTRRLSERINRLADVKAADGDIVRWVTDNIK